MTERGPDHRSSVSPENRYKLPDGTAGYLDGASMDTEIVRALFTRLSGPARFWVSTRSFAESCRGARTAPEASRGQYGQLQEWAEDYEDFEPGHRTFASFRLYPDDQITRANT